MKNHLILLIGENPLPNFITLHYLLNEEHPLPKPNTDSVWLICSEETNTIARKLKEHFDLSTEIVQLKQARNFDYVQDAIDLIKKEIEQLKDEYTVHLNYTGGTKVMSVASSLFLLLQYINQNKFLLSYVDPQEHKLRYIDVNERKDQVVPQDLREYRFDIKDLMDIHNIEGNGNSDISDSYRNFVENMDQNLINELKSMVKDYHSPEKLKTGFINNEINYPSNSELENRLKSLLKGHGVTISGNFSTDMQNISDDKRTEICEFLHGKWLECYLFSILKEANILNTLQINFIGHERSNLDKTHEVDVIGNKGYQLILFSCFSGFYHKEIKSKAIEVAYRAEQLGGSEAKAVLISLFNIKGKSYVPEIEKRKSNKEIFDNITKDLNSTTHKAVSTAATEEKLKEAKLLFINYNDLIGDRTTLINKIKTFIN